MSRSATQSGPEVWERFWRRVPSEARDRRQLDRERRGPRWARLTGELVRVFGRIEGLEVVELGSGRGDLSVLLAERGARVTLVDLSETVLQQARQRFDRLGLGADYVSADLLGTLDGLRDRFDASVSLGVVEHFRGRDRTRVIQAHHDVLKPSGLTLIGAPHAVCIPYRLWKLYLELRGWWAYGMEIPYTRREMRRRAREAGLTDPRVFACGWWQSLGDLWARGIFHCDCDWGHRKSILDNRMGLNLVLMARRGRPSR